MFNLISFLTYLVITATTPGPNNIMSMSNASKYGFRKSFPFNLGIFVGFSGTLCWALFGSVFRQLFSKNAKAFNIIMALLLVYCAVSLFFLIFKSGNKNNLLRGCKSVIQNGAPEWI